MQIGLHRLQLRAPVLPAVGAVGREVEHGVACRPRRCSCRGTSRWSGSSGPRGTRQAGSRRPTRWACRCRSRPRGGCRWPPARGSAPSGRCASRPGRLGRTPHGVGLEAAGIAHRHADQERPLALGGIEECRHRPGVDELIRVIGRQDHRRVARHRQADRRITSHGDALFGRQPLRQLSGQERLPLVGLAAVITARRLYQSV